MLQNTQKTYGIISKSLHWSMALIIFGLLGVGFYFDEISYGANQFELLSLHKSFGLLILWMVALRIIWNRLSKKPSPLPSHQKWEHILAKITHLFLYFALIGMPLSGWIMSMSGGYPVSFFGLSVPSFIDKDSDINALSWQIHQILAYALVIGISLHASGAFKHHFIDKDNTLKRMVFKPVRLFTIFIFFIFVIFIGAMVRLIIF